MIIDSKKDAPDNGLLERESVSDRTIYSKRFRPKSTDEQFYRDRKRTSGDPDAIGDYQRYGHGDDVRSAGFAQRMDVHHGR